MSEATRYGPSPSPSTAAASRAGSSTSRPALVSPQTAQRILELLGEQEPVERPGAIGPRRMGTETHWVQTDSTDKTDDRYPGSWYQYDAEADELVVGDEAWIVRADGGVLFPDQPYLGRMAGIANDRIVFVVDEAACCSDPDVEAYSPGDPDPDIPDTVSTWRAGSQVRVFVELTGFGGQAPSFHSFGSANAVSGGGGGGAYAASVLTLEPGTYHVTSDLDYVYFKDPDGNVLLKAQSGSAPSVVTFPTITAIWAPDAYFANSLVTHSGQTWYNLADLPGADEPGVASGWHQVNAWSGGGTAPPVGGTVVSYSGSFWRYTNGGIATGLWTPPGIDPAPDEADWVDWGTPEAWDSLTDYTFSTSSSQEAFVVSHAGSTWIALSADPSVSGTGPHFDEPGVSGSWTQVTVTWVGNGQSIAADDFLLYAGDVWQSKGTRTSYIPPIDVSSGEVLSDWSGPVTPTVWAMTSTHNSGDVVFYSNARWQANANTTGVPGVSSDWDSLPDQTAAGGTGGQASNCIGDIKHSGGNGGAGKVFANGIIGCGTGGGAGGRLGNGHNGDDAPNSENIVTGGLSGGEVSPMWPIYYPDQFLPEDGFFQGNNGQEGYARSTVYPLIDPYFPPAAPGAIFGYSGGTTVMTYGGTGDVADSQILNTGELNFSRCQIRITKVSATETSDTVIAPTPASRGGTGDNAQTATVGDIGVWDGLKYAPGGIDGGTW